MSTLPTAVGSNSHPVISPQLTPPPLSNPPFTTEEVDVDELASTVEDPPLGHLALFKSVFGIGVSLARYIVDDPLWPILAAAGLPSSFCVHKQWRIIADKIESSTSSTRALLELSPLDDQDQLEEDRLELQDFSVGSRQGPLSPKEEKADSQDRGGLLLKAPPDVVEPRTPSRGNPPNEASPPLQSSGVPLPSPPRAYTSPGGRTTQSGSFGQFVPPTLTATMHRDRIKSPPFPQRNREALRPDPQSQVNTTLKTQNENLVSEVTELRRLLEQGTRLEPSSTTGSLGGSCGVSTCIEAALPDLPSEDVLTCFSLAQSEVGSYREVAIKQKQEIVRLRLQVANVDKCSFKVHEELDAANACAMRLRDCLEELEESVHCYRSRAHIGADLIRQYPEDQGLYDIDLPSLSSMQDKLSESETLVRCLATFAHRLYVADPANVLHYHNMYVEGLI
ncbi:hypothetical protein EV368DRAFT_87944 [Lentinula lateritia]|nr:hypothetical protein EV368DRAFT_87944 [Lentinula lateritia]